MLERQTIYDKLKVILICGLLATITFSKLNLNSLCIILLLGVWLMEGKFKEKGRRLKANTTFLFFFAFTILHFISIFYSPSLQAGWKNAETKAGFLILPLILCSSGITTTQRRRIMLFFSVSITIAALLCLVHAGIRYAASADPDHFFYHTLVAPIKHHAVYFAVFTFICLLFLVLELYNTQRSYLSRITYGTWIAFLFTFIILLSSKMVIAVLLTFLAGVSIYRMMKQKHLKQALAILLIPVVILGGLIAFDNPVKSRFTNLFEGNVSVFTQETFHPSDYFNGFQFRLLLWRVTYLILHDEEAWLYGVSPAAAQQELRNKYQELNLYSGDNETNRGYYDYNCHNQFLQTTLQLGLIGLFILIGLVAAICYKASLVKHVTLLGTLIVLLAFFFTESVLERQYGLMLFALIPLLYLEEKPTTGSATRSLFSDSKSSSDKT